VPAAACDQIVAADREARAPSGDSVGALASAYHASQLPAPAIAAYTVAEALARQLAMDGGAAARGTW
jgi:hypothetical protein